MQSDGAPKNTSQSYGSNQEQAATMFEARPATSSSSTSTVDSTKSLIRTSKEDFVFRIAMKAAIPIGFIAFSIIIIGIVQLALQDNVYAVGISLVSMGALAFIFSICLCVAGAYLASKGSPSNRKTWRLRKKRLTSPAPDRRISNLPLA